VSTSRRPLLVALEGGEGAGKSVQVIALSARLADAGIPYTSTREPGGTKLGEQLRSVLLSSPDQLDPLTEVLLFVAARRELVRQVITPALERDRVVICDRFADSTRAYQGFARGVPLDVIDTLNELATAGREPDLVVFLDLAPEEGLSRRPAAENDDRFSMESIDFHVRVRNGYRALAGAAPEHWLTLDATLPPDQISDEIWSRIAQLLARP
jgi:dTMP kinase